MAQLVVGGEIVQWNGPGLPVRPFRVGIGASTAEYRPFDMNATNNQLRERVIAMLSGGSLGRSMQYLKQLTVDNRATEFSAYIFRTGDISHPQQGTTRHAPTGTAPPGDINGFVHTHPVPDAIIAPPSANDYIVDFSRYPIQLVVEMGGRIWQLFSGGYSSLLGALSACGRFAPTNAESNRLVYFVVSADTLRMEALDNENAAQRARGDQQQQRMREIAERRQREAELRRGR
jgi:hypothetical protein